MTLLELVESNIIPRHWISRNHVVQTDNQRIMYVGKMAYDELKFARFLNRFGGHSVKRIEGHRGSDYYDLLITLANN